MMKEHDLQAAEKCGPKVWTKRLGIFVFGVVRSGAVAALSTGLACVAIGRVWEVFLGSMLFSFALLPAIAGYHFARLLNWSKRRRGAIYFIFFGLAEVYLVGIAILDSYQEVSEGGGQLALFAGEAIAVGGMCVYAVESWVERKRESKT